MKVRGVRIHYIYVQNCYKSKLNKTFHFVLFLISTSEISHLGGLVGKLLCKCENLSESPLHLPKLLAQLGTCL